VRSIAVLFALVVAACGRRELPAGPLLAVDDNGDTLQLAAPAQRVVSLSPATTELLFALGAGSRVVGRTRWCDYPDAALAVPSVGDGIPPNIETVLARQPDLILLYKSSQNQQAADHFRSAGIPTLVLAMDHLADVGRLAQLIGPLVGQRAAGDSLARAYEDALAAASVTSTGSKAPTVLILAWDQPPIVIGAGSFQSEMLTRAGGQNLFADISSPSAPVSIEAIAARDPDVVLISDSGVPAFARRPEWNVIPAVRSRRFLRFSSPAFGRPSPRAPALITELRSLLASSKR
jgi:ABC-type Fe3+-hydroxamate transport system substrate-binding protein